MPGSSMWDVVVLSTLDHSQKVFFETLIGRLSSEYDVADFRVIVDPNCGVKLGSGGSSLFVLDALYKEYKEKLFQKRILLLMVGGYSQRQPMGGALGKLAILAPIDRPRPTTIFELKLQICGKFVPFLPPGVFVSSSDTLEYYDEETIALLHDDDFFHESGFTLLAYRNPLETALNHGVYVLQEEISQDFSQSSIVEKRKIKKILQKPGIALVKSEGAWYFDSDTKSEYIYTDSIYFMASDVIKALLSCVWSENFHVDGEICAYGDFLRPLGPENKPDYAKSPAQLQLYQVLRPFPVQALALKTAKFYHLGTLHENLFHYCSDLLFAENFNFTKLSNVKFVQLAGQKVDTKTPVKGCVMSSILTEDSTVPQTCIVEHCLFEKGLEIGEPNTILSNCTSDQRAIIDRSMFILTVSIFDDADWSGGVAYVTFVFETFTDFKLVHEKDESMLYFGLPVKQAAQYWNNSSDEESTDIFGTGPKSMWHAKMFPAFSTMAASFDKSLEFAKFCIKFPKNNLTIDSQLFNDKKLAKTHGCYSFYDAMLKKNVVDMLKYRDNLCAKICKN